MTLENCLLLYSLFLITHTPNLVFKIHFLAQKRRQQILQNEMKNLNTKKKKKKEIAKIQLGERIVVQWSKKWFCIQKASHLIPAVSM